MNVIDLDTDPELLAARRAALVVPRAAFRLALASLPAPAPFEDALALADHIGAAPETPRAARVVWADAVTFGRLYPEVTEWAPALAGAVAPGLEDVDALLDAVFELALALDQKDMARAGAVLAAIGGLVS